MNTGFNIEVKLSPGRGADDALPISVSARDVVFTRLLRPGSDQPDNFLEAPPAQLAFWLVDNWWRLRFECVPSGRASPDWRLRHELAAIGGGYVWPRLRIWGDGEGVGLACYADPPGVLGPVRYVVDALTYVSGSAFEAGVDSFFAMAVDGASGFGSDRHALASQVESLRIERADPQLSSWRRLEAQAGFDPDSAPDALMHELAGLAERFGERGVEEAVLAYPGIDAATELGREIAAASKVGLRCDLSEAVRSFGGPLRTDTVAPWRVAEEAGKRIRSTYSVSSGPLANRELLSMIKADTRSLDNDQQQSESLKYALLLRDDKTACDQVALRSRWASSRRFELARAIGDAAWTGGDALGPIARSKTARQQFQRAFAQNLLCPIDDLLEYVGTTDPSADDVQAAAKYFDVSERVVQTALVNKHIIDRGRFEELIDEAA